MTTELYCLKNLETIIDAIPAAAIIINHNYDITFCNKNAELLFNSSRNTIIGQNICKMLDSVQLAEMPIDDTLNNGNSHIGLEKTFHYNEQIFQTSLDLLPLKDPKDKIAGAMAIIKDLAGANGNKKRLEHLEILAGIGQMAAGTVHEIRNPLTSVNGFVQLLQVRAVRQKDDQALGYCKLITNEVTHINNILSDFLTLAKPSDKKIDKINLTQLVQDVTNLLYGEALLFQISIHYTPPTSPTFILGFAEKIKEVLINICRNAFQAMTPGGILTLTLTQSQENVLIEIADTGHGMTEATIADIFKPFFTTKDTGTGLGLAICQRIMHEHNGDIRVKSTLGQGSIFTMVFPVQQEILC